MTNQHSRPAAARHTDQDQPTPSEHDPHQGPCDHDQHSTGEEQGEQWRHDELGEQAVISEASRQPGGVQRSTTVEPDDEPGEVRGSGVERYPTSASGQRIPPR